MCYGQAFTLMKFESLLSMNVNSGNPLEAKSPSSEGVNFLLKHTWPYSSDIPQLFICFLKEL
jgi:hypothetical protein